MTANLRWCQKTWEEEADVVNNFLTSILFQSSRDCLCKYLSDETAKVLKIWESLMKIHWWHRTLLKIENETVNHFIKPLNLKTKFIPSEDNPKNLWKCPKTGNEGNDGMLSRNCSTKILIFLLFIKIKMHRVKKVSPISIIVKAKLRTLFNLFWHQNYQINHLYKRRWPHIQLRCLIIDFMNDVEN